MNSYLAYELGFYKHVVFHSQGKSVKEEEKRLAKTMLWNHFKGVSMGNLMYGYYRLVFKKYNRGVFGKVEFT